MPSLIFFPNFLAVLVACVYSANIRNKRQAASKFLLPDGAELILSGNVPVLLLIF